MTYSSLISKSWQVAKNNWGMYVGLTVITIFLAVIANSIPFVGSFIGGVINLGYIVCILKISKGESIDFNDLFWSFLSLPRFIQSALMVFLVGIIIVIGFVLLLVPGFWACVALSFTHFCFVTQSGENDALSAVKKSIQLVKDRWFWVAGFLSVLVLLNIVGFLALGVGLLITLPMSSLSMFYLLEHLESTVNVVPVEVVEPR